MICVRGECAPPSQGKQLERRLLDLLTEYGLDQPDHDHYTRCTVTNCLAVCEQGPVMIVQPEGIRYQHVDEAALERIFHQHLRQDQPVTDLMVESSFSISQRKKERRRRHKRR